MFAVQAIKDSLNQPTLDVNKSNCILHICGVNVGKYCISGGTRKQLWVM